MLEICLKQAILVTLVVSGLPLLASSVVGLLVGMLQTATQIQEQSVGFVARVAAVIVTLALLAEWFSSQLLDFFSEMLTGLARIGGMQ